jgi:carbamoyltransferase
MRVLGISPMHDSSVALINNGHLEYFCKEERLTRDKRDSMPFLSINNAFRNTKGPIDFIVISSPTKTDTRNEFIEDYLFKITKTKIARLCEHHHLSHASLAFYNSGFDKALTVVIDRNGSHFDRLRESESIFICNYPNHFKPIYKSFWLEKIGFFEDQLNRDKISERITSGGLKDCEIVADSTMNITKVYESATTLIGQLPLENGKTMGLAGYGKNKKFKSLFVDDIPNTNLFTNGSGEADFVDTYGPPIVYKKYFDDQVKEVPRVDYQLYADFAFQVQKQTQEQVLKLIKKYVKKTKIKSVCVTGGYGLNVVTNEYLIKNLPEVDFYFEPMADDAGNSIGAAMFIYRSETKDSTIHPLKHTFFNNIRHNINVEGEEVTTKNIAKYLSESKVVAVFNGQAEAGPRALGNRSILFDPRNARAKDIINNIKKREWYRPYAGSILIEHFKDYFETHHIKSSPFMTVSFQVKKDKKNLIPGMVHVDQSCRVQTVDKEIPHYYNLLKEFYKITNVPALLNTSFNVAGEALVETVEDAVNTFNKTDIDILWFPELKKTIKKLR